jgi:hypothetical protein
MAIAIVKPTLILFMSRGSLSGSSSNESIFFARRRHDPVKFKRILHRANPSQQCRRGSLRSTHPAQQLLVYEQIKNKVNAN